MAGLLVGLAFKVRDLQPSEKLVLVKLADQANDEGICWPSVRYLEGDTGLSRRAIQMATAVLQERGLVEVIPRENNSNVYKLTLPHPAQPMHSPGQQSHGGAQKSGGGGALHAPVRRNHCAQNLKETSLNLNEPPAHGLNGHAGDFERFYKIYPVHKGRGAAIRAFKKAIQRAPIATIIAAAERYRDDPGRKPEFTKHPATWLNGECWSDEGGTITATPKFDNDAHDRALHLWLHGDADGKGRRVGPSPKIEDFPFKSEGTQNA